MNKKYIILGVIVLIALAVSFVIAYNYYNEPFRKCMRELKSDIKAHQVQYIPGSIVASFKSGITKEQQKSLVEPYGMQVTYQYKSSNDAAVKVPQNMELESVCRLKLNPNVASAELNVIFSKK